jgi:hypothetical protein
VCLYGCNPLKSTCFSCFSTKSRKFKSQRGLVHVSVTLLHVKHLNSSWLQGHLCSWLQGHLCLQTLPGIPDARTPPNSSKPSEQRGFSEGTALPMAKGRGILPISGHHSPKIETCTKSPGADSAKILRSWKNFRKVGTTTIQRQEFSVELGRTRCRTRY